MAASTDKSSETVAADLLLQIDGVQTEEVKSGKYWQGLPTHVVPPKDGGVKSADNSSSTPTDQSKNWQEAGITLPPTQPCSFSVTIYDGPLGQGYDLIARYDEGSDRHQRTWSVGLETWREHDWRVFAGKAN